MNRKILLPLLTLIVALIVGNRAFTAAHSHEDGEKVKVISSHEMKEKLDGKEAKATVVEVIIEPGQAGLPHRHPGPGLVYVAEGEYELGIDNQPTKIYKAGQTFYEPTGCLHSVSKNPAKHGRTRLIAFVLHPRDTDEVAVPEKTNKKQH